LGTTLTDFCRYSRFLFSRRAAVDLWRNRFIDLLLEKSRVAAVREEKSEMESLL